ncbi:hypothetical protein BSL78_14215 [Apostichopus japonicus]|uniref:Uncharacterized protein n=1 Tax=Stichopus japonicus TaxID=307972 RepID=A0A2G8KLM8_STIJA|nr:hypothetical protein BSL78_14215 [Apostichopus japonicus]
MYSVRQSLKRSLPKVAGQNNLSALMMMADGMFQEMSLDRGLDELAWPYDPLAELRESGLALVDYMEPTPTVPTAEKRSTHMNSNEEKSVRVPSKLSIPLLFSRNVNCSEKQDTPSKNFNAVSTTSQIVPGGRRSITMDHIKPIGGINRFSELFGQILRMPRIPVMILQSALNPFKRGITHPQVTDNSIDGKTVNQAMVPFYRKTSQPLSTEGARSKSLPNITSNYQLIPIEINKESHTERCIARNIRPHFLGKFYQKNIIDALQTTAEIKARTSWPKVKLGNPVQSYTVCQSLMRSLPKTTGKKNLSALMTLADEMFEEMSLDRQMYSDFDPLVELNSSDLSVDYMLPSRALLGPSTDLDEIPSSQVVSGSESKWLTTQCSLGIEDLHAGYQNKGLDSPSGETLDEEATFSASDCLPGSQEVVSTEEDMSQDIETQETAKIVEDDALEDALTLHSPNEMNDPTECHREEHGPETSSHKDEDNLSEDSALGKDISNTSLPENDESIVSQTADSTFRSNQFEQFAKQGNSDIDDDVGNSQNIQLPNRSRKVEEKVSQFVKCDPCDDSDNSVVDRNVSPDMKSRIDMFEAFQKPYTST